MASSSRKQFTKLELLQLRPAKVDPTIENSSAFQHMIQIANTIKTRGGNNTVTGPSRDEIVHELLNKESLKQTNKHRNYLRRERARQRKRLYNQHKLQEEIFYEQQALQAGAARVNQLFGKNIVATCSYGNSPELYLAPDSPVVIDGSILYAR